MKRFGLAVAAIAAALTASPAAAQRGGFDGVQFIEAVRSRDGAKAMELIRSRPTVVNARGERGETPLNVALSRRDEDWTFFLLQKGADPNLAGENGDTPLIAAARFGFEEAAATLLKLGAKVDSANKMGETPLILAVQQRHPEIVKLLLAAGADPDRSDSAAGYSARDYARRDARARDILSLIEGARAKPAVSEDLNKFKL